MPNTVTLNFDFIPKRLLKITEAAKYLGLPPKRLPIECPVAPIELSDGQKRYDVRDLDAWIEGLKPGAANDDDAILSRLSA